MEDDGRDGAVRGCWMEGGGDEGGEDEGKIVILFHLQNLRTEIDILDMLFVVMTLNKPCVWMFRVCSH